MSNINYKPIKEKIKDELEEKKGYVRDCITGRLFKIEKVFSQNIDIPDKEDKKIEKNNNWCGCMWQKKYRY